MDDSTFTTSIPARKAAVCIIGAARERGYMDGPLITAPELAEIEKKLFLKMFSALPGSDKITDCALTSEQMSALFTFVFANNIIAFRIFDYFTILVFQGASKGI